MFLIYSIQYFDIFFQFLKVKYFNHKLIFLKDVKID